MDYSPAALKNGFTPTEGWRNAYVIDPDLRKNRPWVGGPQLRESATYYVDTLDRYGVKIKLRREDNLLIYTLSTEHRKLDTLMSIEVYVDLTPIETAYQTRTFRYYRVRKAIMDQAVYLIRVSRGAWRE